MKTPDEIKKWLECCTHVTCDGCPYDEDGCATSQQIIDALEYIHQLENHIGELTEKVALLEEAQPKWISLKERLPEDGETVLTYKNGFVEVQMYEKKRNGWIDRGNWFWFMAIVAYWMPLPEPPKEEAHD